MDILKREYGSLLMDRPEPDYHVSLEINLEQVPPEGGKILAAYVTFPFSQRLQRPERRLLTPSPC
jgi:hypothetical protein